MPVVKDKDMTPQNGQVDEVKLVYKEKPVINIDGITARDMLGFTSDRDVRFGLYTRGAVVSVPDHWGAGDLRETNTYRELKMRHLIQINRAFSEAMNQAQPKEVPGFSIDVWDITVRETEDLDDMGVVRLCAKYAKTVPAGWGGIRDVDTYLNLPYPIWLAVQDVIQEALADLGKN